MDVREWDEARLNITETKRGADQKQPAECRVGKGWYIWPHRLYAGKKVGEDRTEIQPRF